MENEQPVKPRRRGIYLLPNLFTTGCLFGGFFSIIYAINGKFEMAAIAIFIAMILDGLDGRVARLTNTQSEFGVQYDSLADMVSFGVAPGILMYQWALTDIGKLGWLGAFMYTAGAALRLARFNTQAASSDKRFFQGLPSPAAAAMVAGAVWVGADMAIDGKDIPILAWLVTVSAGLLMVSNFRYYSFKELDLRGKVPFVAMLFVVLVFVFVSIDPPQVLFLIFMAFGFSGPVLTMVLLRKKRKERRQGLQEDDQIEQKELQKEQQDKQDD
ncbi:MAG: CDP-diacylglycerol--serine O-phosphatidyltransferase [Gammaproteobacteria bacterium]|nr:CDP-diacylglycerol--serine O-phosphatidyltransferase [Gammaproteobacteria bacterium]